MSETTTDLPAETPAENEAVETAAPVAETQQETPAPEPEAPKAEERRPEKDWRLKRIDELTAQKHAERQRAEREAIRAAELEARLAAFERGDEQQPRQQEQPLGAEQIRREAEVLAATARFNEECERVYDAGRDAYPDFERVLGNFTPLGGLTPAFAEAAIATGAGHAVLYELGKDPDRAMRIMRMNSPIKMAVELSKVAAQVTAPKPLAVSKAPPPIDTVRGGAKPAVNLEDPNLSQAAWEAERNKTRRTKW